MEIPPFLLLGPPDSASPRVSPVHSSVPASSQGEVDDHVHRDQIRHRIVVGSHGAQDPLPGLKVQKPRLTTTSLCVCFFFKKKL